MKTLYRLFSFIYSHSAILIFLIFFLITGGLTARRFPILNPDEIIVMVNAYSIMQGHGVRYFLNQDIYPPAIDRLADLSNHIARPFFDAALGPWVIFGHRHFEVVRLFSLTTGAAALLLLYFLGVQWQGRRLGFLFVFVCLFNPVFLAACLVINEHVLLMTIGIGLLLIQGPLSKKLGWPTYLWGGLSASLFFVHQNGIVLWMSLLTFGLCTVAQGRRLRWALLIGVGGLSGFLIFMRAVDLPRMILFQKAIYWTFAKPPLLTWPWHPLAWLASTSRLLFDGPTYYFFHDHGPLPTAWAATQRMYWAMMALAGVGFTVSVIKMRGASFYVGPLLFSIGTGLIFMTTLIRRQEAFYVLTLLPITVPLFGIFADRLLAYSRQVFLSAVLLAGFVPFLFVRFAWTYSEPCLPWSSLLSQVKVLVKPSSEHVLAPNVLWAEFPVESFRDIGAVVNVRYFIDAPLIMMLSAWKPSVLITDNSFRKAYGLAAHDSQTLTRLIGHPVTWKGSVDTKNAYGLWEIYRVDWMKP